MSGPTRGSGLLEDYLSKKRTEKALALLSDHNNKGALLDIGCGTRPKLLLQAPFINRYGIEQFPPQLPQGCGVNALVADVGKAASLPFEDQSFDAVTMLAVLEHLPPDRIVDILKEIRRVLVDGGKLVLTTPAPWTEGLLTLMARIGLVSKEEIEEHAQQYSAKQITEMLSEAGFDRSLIRTGHFELGANVWAAAVRR